MKLFLISFPLAVVLAGLAWFIVPVNEVIWDEPDQVDVSFSVENKRNRTIAAYDFVMDAWRDDRRTDALAALKELYLNDLSVVFEAARLNQGRNTVILEQRYGRVMHLMGLKIKQDRGLQAIGMLKTSTLAHLDALAPEMTHPIASNDD